MTTRKCKKTRLFPTKNDNGLGGFPVAVLIIILMALAHPASAQESTPAPGGRAFTSGAIAGSPLPGAVGSSQRFLVTSAANDKGVFLWVIDAVERQVTLCERSGSGAEFTCSKRPLP